MLAARLSVVRGEIDGAAAERLRALLGRAKLPTEAPALGPGRYRELMARDKKVLAGAVRFILLRGIGEAYVASDVTDGQLEQVLPR